MKKILLFLVIIFFSLGLKAQTNEYFEPEEVERPRFYLGIGTGINSYTGLLGISGNFILDKKLFLQAGFGLSSWGFRSSLGLRYDAAYRNGFTFGINFANSSGVDDIDLELETSSGTTRDVNMRLESTNSIHLKTGYNWWIGENNTFNINVGYAFALASQPWVVNDGSRLSATSDQVMRLIAPGGIIIGLGFTFGLGG